MGVKEGLRLWGALPYVKAVYRVPRLDAGNRLWETAWVTSYGGFF